MTDIYLVQLQSTRGNYPTKRKRRFCFFVTQVFTPLYNIIINVATMNGADLLWIFFSRILIFFCANRTILIQMVHFNDMMKKIIEGIDDFNACNYIEFFLSFSLASLILHNRNWTHLIRLNDNESSTKQILSLWQFNLRKRIKRRNCLT